MASPKFKKDETVWLKSNNAFKMSIVAATPGWVDHYTCVWLDVDGKAQNANFSAGLLTKKQPNDSKLDTIIKMLEEISKKLS